MRRYAIFGILAIFFVMRVALRFALPSASGRNAMVATVPITPSGAAPAGGVATAAGASGSATAPAQPAPAQPVSVLIGVGGASTWNSACVPIRVTLDASAKGIDGTLRVRSPMASLTWTMPIHAEPGARRTLHEVACLSGYAGAGSWQWSLDGTTWNDANTRLITPPLVATIGPEVGRIAALEEALSPQWGGGTASNPAVATQVDPHSIGLAPEDAPTAAEGWSAADIVLLDAQDAPALPPEAVDALADHVTAGATLVVFGAQESGLPDRLLAARAKTVTTAQISGADGSSTVAALDLDPVGGATPVALAGITPAPAWARSAGFGRLVTIGLDLSGSAARDAIAKKDWLDIVGKRVTQGSGASTEPPWLSAVDGILEQSSSLSASAKGVVSPSIAAAYLVFVALASGLGTIAVARRRKGPATRRDVALLLAGLAAPGFALGFFRPKARPESLVVVEHFESTGRSRVVSWVRIAEKGRAALPEGVVTLSATSALRNGLPEATIDLGQPALELPHEPGLARITAGVESWRTETGVPRTRLMASRWPRAVVTGGNLGAIQDADTSASTTGLFAAVAGSVGSEAYLALEPGTPRTLWIVHP